MGYPLYEAIDPLWIREQEVGSALKRIQFSTFTSCIGVVTRVGERLTAVHLVMFGGNRLLPEQRRPSIQFDTHTAEEVLKRLPPRRDETLVIGFTQEWNPTAAMRANPNNAAQLAMTRDVQAGYEKLVGLIGAHWTYPIDEDGCWEVCVEGGKLVPKPVAKPQHALQEYDKTW